MASHIGRRKFLVSLGGAAAAGDAGDRVPQKCHRFERDQGLAVKANWELLKLLPWVKEEGSHDKW
jgi:hypothetical protein